MAYSITANDGTLKPGHSIPVVQLNTERELLEFMESPAFQTLKKEYPPEEYQVHFLPAFHQVIATKK